MRARNLFSCVALHSPKQTHARPKEPPLASSQRWHRLSQATIRFLNHLDLSRKGEFAVAGDYLVPDPPSLACVVLSGSRQGTQNHPPLYNDKTVRKFDRTSFPMHIQRPELGSRLASGKCC